MRQRMFNFPSKDTVDRVSFVSGKDLSRATVEEVFKFFSATAIVALMEGRDVEIPYLGKLKFHGALAQFIPTAAFKEALETVDQGGDMEYLSEILNQKIASTLCEYMER